MQTTNEKAVTALCHANATPQRGALKDEMCLWCICLQNYLKSSLPSRCIPL